MEHTLRCLCGQYIEIKFLFQPYFICEINFIVQLALLFHKLGINFLLRVFTQTLKIIYSFYKHKTFTNRLVVVF